MKVGSRVKVVDFGKQYSGYERMFQAMGIPFDKEDITTMESRYYKDSVFVIFSKKRHFSDNTMICGIIDEKGNQFLVGKEGLEKIKKPKKVKEEPKYKSFPKLMKSKDSDLLVLFESEGYGQVVKSDDNHIIGRISKYWAMDEFKDIDAELIIKYNKK